MKTGHEIRAFRASETTHLSSDNPVSISGFLFDNQSKIDKKLQKYANCFCARRIKLLTPEISEDLQESLAIVLKLIYFEK